MDTYKIQVLVNLKGQTEVTKCLDPLFDAKLLLEGVGVLIAHISECSKTKPLSPESKEIFWSMEREDVLKLLHVCLDEIAKEYEDQKTSLVLKFNKNKMTCG